MTPARVLAAPLAFKGTLTPTEAAEAIASALERVTMPCRRLPLADGGTGMLDALLAARGGDAHPSPVPTASYQVDFRRWGMTAAREALIEAAEIVGLAGVPLAARDPSILTTLGLGLLVRSALDHHPRSIIIGIGDTATHDCALGVGAVLGYRFLNALGGEITPVGRSLPLLAAIDSAAALPIDPALPVRLFCDVMNPLLGPDGAARRFASQKGADAAMVEMLERGGERFAEVVLRDLGHDVAEVPGAGAGGGLGAGLMAFLGGRPESGADALLEAVGFAEAVEEADVVITGEGRLDGKTLLGKGVGRVAAIVTGAGRELLVIAGSVEGERGWWEERLGCRVIELGSPAAGLPERERLARAAIDGMRLMGRAMG